jgi:hypothetical protein
MVFDLRLCVNNVVGLLDFDRIFDALIVHPRFVLVLGHHNVLIVGLVSRARSHSVVFLMQHHKVLAHYGSALSDLEWNVFNWLLESVR